MMTGLVLGGGGANGAYEAGACLALAEAGWSFDAISGVSVGSVGAYGLAQYPKSAFLAAAKNAVTMWLSLTGDHDVYRYRQPKYLAGLVAPSLCTTDPLEAFLRAHLDPNRIRVSGVQVRVSAVDLLTGDSVLFTEHDDPVVAAMASASFPLAFPPVDDGRGHVLTDGGVRDVIPLSLLLKLGCSKLAIVATQPERVPVVTWKDVNTVLDQAKRDFQLIMNEIEKNDLAMLEQINAWIAQGFALPGKRHIDTVVIRPKTSLGDSLSFDAAKNDRLIEQGREDAKEALALCTP